MLDAQQMGLVEELDRRLDKRLQEQLGGMQKQLGGMQEQLGGMEQRLDKRLDKVQTLVGSVFEVAAAQEPSGARRFICLSDMAAACDLPHHAQAVQRLCASLLHEVRGGRRAGAPCMPGSSPPRAPPVQCANRA